METKYDAIVIGTGQAGPSLAVRLAGTGMKVAIIERNRFGGTCVNNGCIPTKTLVASARAAHVARRASDYGVTIRGPIAVDMKKVKMRKDALVRQSSEGVEKWLRNTQNLTVIEGHARFADAHRFVSAMSFSKEINFLSTLADARLFLRSGASMR